MSLWEYFEGYAYNIDPKRIKSALLLLEQPEIFNFVESEISGDWQDAEKLEATTLIPNDLKHPIRIAYLVKMIPSQGMSPVWIDTMCNSHSKTEGHHRLLALKFLGYKMFPATFSGLISEFPPRTRIV